MTDNTVYVARLHRIIFLGPLVFTAAAFFLTALNSSFQMMGFAAVAFGLLWAGAVWVNYYFSSLTIETKRVIFRTGVLVRNTTDIPYPKIESIDIRQSIVGSIFRYGSLTITGTGGTKHTIDFVARPLTCRRYMEQLMHN